MKRKLVMGVSLLMSVAMLAGCGGSNTEEQPPAEDNGADVVEETTGALKTGLGVVTTIDKSKDATAEEEGQGQAYTMIAAVTVDSEGKIVQAIVDGIQPTAKFDATGAISTDLATTFDSKLVAKEAYGMKGASSIGKEWSEQSEAFSQYIVGKTADEVKAIALDGDGKASDDDLKSSVTITTSVLMDVVVKAMENAEELGANAGDKLGLAVDGTIAKSADATAEAEGVVEGYSNIVVATFDADGKTTSAIVDAAQTKINFDATGKITSDLTVAYPTKVELGEDYGMKKASAIGKEWSEQAKEMSNYFTGKTAAEVMAIPLNEEGRPTEDDLKSSVTVHINDQVKLLGDAFNTAK